MPSYGRMIIGKTYSSRDNSLSITTALMIMLLVIVIPNKHNHAVGRIDYEDSFHSSSCLS